MRTYKVEGYFVEATGTKFIQNDEHWLKDRRITVEVGESSEYRTYIFDQSETNIIADLTPGQEVTLTVTDESESKYDYVWSATPGDTPHQQLRRLATQVKEIKEMLDTRD